MEFAKMVNKKTLFSFTRGMNQEEWLEILALGLHLGNNFHSLNTLAKM